MENMPKNVINKIMLYTSHPVADILRESSIFRALELENGIRVHGSPFDRGEMDAYYARGYDPHKMEAHLGRMVKSDLESEHEKNNYEAAYLHTFTRKFWTTRREQHIFDDYGYYARFSIRPLWSLQRNEEICEDMHAGQDSD
jgi:hypothetical protein